NPSGLPQFPQSLGQPFGLTTVTTVLRLLVYAISKKRILMKFLFACNITVQNLDPIINKL
ncbi:MAG: hypothetical protein ABII27_09575, partial [bacterium]